VRIVIADDLRITRQVLAGYLERLGHEVVGQAENGRDAIAFCRQLHPDLVTLDWAMNHINGDEAARIIRRENLAKNILFITSHGQKVVKSVADEVVALQIIKPFRDQQLGSIIEEIQRESLGGCA
jgi:two-component system chemotaxis response regulator CheY